MINKQKVSEKDFFLQTKSFSRSFTLSFIFIIFLFSCLMSLWLYYHPNTEYLIPSVVIFLFFIIFFIFFMKLIKRKMNHYSSQVKKTLSTALYTPIPQLEIIISFFISLLNISKSDEKNTILHEKYESIKINISSVKDFISSVHFYQQLLKDSHFIEPPLLIFLEEEMKRINIGLYDLSLVMSGNIEDFSGIYFKAKNNLEKFNETMASLIYYLQNMIPIISDMSGSSIQFSKKIMFEVIQKFKEISNFSFEINKDIEKVMQSLMDENQHDTLAYIIKQAHQVITDFEMFFKNINNLKSLSDEFITKTGEKLNNIASMANSIEKIASTMKVISLNVNIEAAKTSGNDAKGFLVLGKDLKEFADKTMKFAQDVKTKVKDAIHSTENMGKNYHGSMDEVFIYMEEIKKSLESFEKIIQASFGKIKMVVSTLQNFSNNIDKDVKSIVGKLQTYDITSQEVEHISLFISNIFKLFESYQSEINFDNVLHENKKLEIKEEILTNIQKVITTGGESIILKKYAEIFGVKLQGSGHIDTDKEESVILF
ncbi:MAG: hypothetical protein A2Y41_01450 [Spirochaetes bacterium GWB1_36_13]|nr:MAG: hypothetical protein A2Y41_01450 [Spirochaetes bacterium GWB1_36_13]